VVRSVDETGDQQDRTDRDEDVLAEELPDRVGTGRKAFDLLSHGLGKCPAEPALGGALGHGIDQRSDQRRRAVDRGQAQRGADLADELVEDQQATGGERVEPRDQPAALLLQTEAFDQPDDRQDEDEERDRPVRRETIAEGIENGYHGQVAEESGHDARNGDDDEGVQPQSEADDDEEYADEYQHDRPPSRVGD
jgi:hypothetical protein